MCIYTCKTSLRLIRRIGGSGRGCRTIVTNAIKPSPKHVQIQNSLQTASETHKQHFDQGYETAAETSANITFALQTAPQTCQQHFNEAYKTCQQNTSKYYILSRQPHKHTSSISMKAIKNPPKTCPNSAFSPDSPTDTQTPSLKTRANRRLGG